MSGPTADWLRRAVWKFAIPEADWSLGAPFQLPSQVAVTQIVHAEMEHNVLFIWAEVLPDRRGQLGPRVIVHGTGNLIEPRESHLITIRDGRFVWHLYYSPEATS